MHNVPKFPDFKKLTLEDRDWYNAYFSRFEPYTDFSFGNLIIWLDQYDDLECSQLHGNIILKCTNLFMEGSLMLTFLGVNELEDTIDKLLAYQLAHGEPEELLGIPELVFKNLALEQKMFEITEDRDNYEYILDVNMLATLEGPSMRKMRREVSVFRRREGEQANVKELDLSNPVNTRLIHDSVHSWEKAFTTNESAHQEAAVLDRTLEYAKELEYENISVFIGDELASFILYQHIPQPNFVILNHIKSSYKYRYAFEFMLYSLANILKQRSFKYINFEQDLGIPGLRAHKESLKPVYFLKKYIIRRRGSSKI